MSWDEFVARLFEGFEENFPDLTDAQRQVVQDEIETAIFNEMSLGGMRFDESGLARLEFALAGAFDRLGVLEELGDDSE